MKFTPLGFNVLLRLEREPEASAGGIILPEQTRDERARRAVVLAVGEGYLMPDNSVRPLRVKEGDLVIPAYRAGTSIEWQGETLLLLSERDILGVLREDDEEGKN